MQIVSARCVVSIDIIERCASINRGGNAFKYNGFYQEGLYLRTLRTYVRIFYFLVHLSLSPINILFPLVCHYDLFDSSCVLCVGLGCLLTHWSAPRYRHHFIFLRTLRTCTYVYFIFWSICLCQI